MSVDLVCRLPGAALRAEVKGEGLFGVRGGEAIRCFDGYHSGEGGKG